MPKHRRAPFVVTLTTAALVSAAASGCSRESNPATQTYETLATPSESDTASESDTGATDTATDDTGTESAR